MALKPPPYLQKLSDRNDLAARINTMITAYQSDLGELPDRIARCEDYYDNRVVPTKQKPWSTAPEFQIPLTKQRIRQRKASIVQSLVGVDPIFRFKSLTDLKYTKEIEDRVRFHLSVTDFTDALGKTILRSLISSFAVLRCLWHEDEDGYRKSSIVGPFAGLAFDVIHPMDFIGYPISSTDITETRIHGHRFTMMADEITYLQKTGVWFNDVENHGGDNPTTARSRDSNLIQQNNDATPGEEESELWDLIIRYYVGNENSKKNPLTEKTVRVIVRPATNNILYAREFDNPMSPYVIFTVDPDERQLFPEGSAAQDLQGLQIMLNSLVNQFFWQSMSASRPPVLTERADLPKGIKGYAPGQIFKVRSIGTSLPLPSAFQPQAFAPLIGMVQQWADGASQVSDTITGAPSGHNPATATEEEIKFQGFQLTGNDDVRQLREPMRQIAKLILFYLRKYYPNWAQLYPQLAFEDPDILQQPMLIELGGEDISSSPQTLVQQSQSLIQLFGMLPQILQGVQAMGPAMIKMVFNLTRTIILSTNLPNKDEMIDEIDGMIESLGNGQQEQAPPGQTDPNQIDPNQAQQIMDALHTTIGAHAAAGGAQQVA